MWLEQSPDSFSCILGRCIPTRRKMSQFAIFFQLAFLYIFYAPAETREKILEIAAARITSTEEGVSPQVFNTGEVYLYRISREAAGRLKYYVIGDESDQDCLEFPIARHNTVVTKDSFTIKWFERTITFILKEYYSTFKSYRALLPLGKFASWIPIVKAFQGMEELKIENGVIRMEAIENDELLLAIADDRKLRVLFPKSCVTILPKMESAKEVLIELRTEPTVAITILFDGSVKANIFYNYLTLWPNHAEAALVNLRYVDISD